MKIKNKYKKFNLSPSFSTPNFKDKNFDSTTQGSHNINDNYQDNYEDKNNNVIMINNFDQTNFNSNLNYENNNYSEQNSNEQTEQDNFFYNEYFYKAGDSYEELVNKNKNLKILFEKTKSELIQCVKEQQKMEIKYKAEKNEIFGRLEKIQHNYEKYANSHNKLQNFENKIDEISGTYNKLLQLFFITNGQLNEFKKMLSYYYKKVNDFVDKNFDNHNINMISFEFILHLRNQMKSLFEKENFNENNNKEEVKVDKSKYIDNKNYTKENDNKINTSRFKDKRKNNKHCSVDNYKKLMDKDNNKDIYYFKEIDKINNYNQFQKQFKEFNSWKGGKKTII